MKISVVGLSKIQWKFTKFLILRLRDRVSKNFGNQYNLHSNVPSFPELKLTLAYSYWFPDLFKTLCDKGIQAFKELIQY